MKNMPRKKGGWVYTAESTRKDGSKRIYTGMTRKKPAARWGQHKKEVKKTNSKTWTGKGKSFRPIGAVWSSNPAKAEKTVKKMSPAQKRSFGRIGAKRYYKKRRK
jgi:hypothetical protein